MVAPKANPIGSAHHRLSGMVMAFVGILGYTEMKRKMGMGVRAREEAARGEDGVPLVQTPKADR